MNNLLLFVYFIFVKIQLSVSQNQFCQQGQPNCCDTTCSDCSQDKISQCTSCKQGYFYFSEKYQCLETCPQYTYPVDETKYCKSCSSQYCLTCTESVCLQCQSNFMIDPQNKNNCISKCSLEGKVQDENGQCNINCIDEKYYNIDNKSKTCVATKICASMKKTPELTNKSQIISSLLNNNRTSMISIDDVGQVVVYSYPELTEQLSYQLATNTQNVVDCNFPNENSHFEGKITCLLTPVSLLSFYYINGTVINLSSINDKLIQKNFDSGQGWSLILAGSSLTFYNLQLIDYQNMKSMVLDTFTGKRLIVKMIKPYSALSMSHEVFNFNVDIKQIIYYQSYPLNKVVVSNFTLTEQKFDVMQLSSYQYWVYYSNYDLVLLKFNKEALSMVKLQSITFQDTIKQISLKQKTNVTILFFNSYYQQYF